MSGVPPLSDRKQRILRAIVLEYIQTAEPIASDAVVSKYELGVKSATVRSEMADITDQGLLDQPHTSAGRIPSDSGYRYFVDRLMEPEPLARDQKRAIKSRTESEDTLQSLLESAVRMLSRTTHLASAAATIRDAETPILKAIITALGPKTALLVLMLRNGAIENRVLTCPAELTLEDLGRANEILEGALEGMTLGRLTKLRLSVDANPRVASLLDRAAAELRATAKDLTRGRLVIDGEEYVVTQPEFQRNPELGHAVLDTLDDEDALRTALVEGLDDERFAIIGREHSQPEMRLLTVIRRPFKVGSTATGAIAIIGPTRLDYERGASLVTGVADAISQTLGRIYGEAEGPIR